MNVLVTGATGAVGPALVKLLIKKKYNVRVLLHKKTDTKMLPNNVEAFYGDINNIETLNKAVETTDFVFHLAGMLHLNNPKLSLKKQYYTTNVEGTKNVVQASRLMGVKRVVFFSTISVYGSNIGLNYDKVFNETSPINPETLYAKTKYDAEQAVADIINYEGKPLVTILRLASVYGTNMKGNYLKLLDMITKGWFVFIGSGENRRTMVCDKDVATAAFLAATDYKASGEVFNVTDSYIYTFREILDAVFAVFHRPVIRLNLPYKLVYTLIRLASIIFPVSIFSPTPIFSMVDKLVEDVAVCGDKIVTNLGFYPKYNIKNGWLEPKYKNRKGISIDSHIINFTRRSEEAVLEYCDERTTQ